MSKVYAERYTDPITGAVTRYYIRNKNPDGTSTRVLHVCAWCCSCNPNKQGFDYDQRDRITKAIEDMTKLKASHGVCPECAKSQEYFPSRKTKK